MEMNVKAFIKYESKRLFEDRVLEPIKIEPLRTYQRHSAPDVFGIAFNIAFDYELFKRGLISNYAPHQDYIAPLYDEEIAAFDKVEKKQELNARDLLILVNHENLSRFENNMAMYMQLSSHKFSPADEENMRLDLTLMSSCIHEFFSSVSKTDKFIQNPDFFSKRVDIYGDGDFIMNDILFEIKCVSSDNIETKTQKQLILYKLINDIDEDKRKYTINKFGYYNPLKGQIHTWDAIIPESVMNHWREYVSLTKKTTSR
ncbi:MAG: hypothetical protein A2017_17505 [Lentisphaerae bacterium GWF2_44_16]|nr:MAG: hypothetical protein A2017_17505 [Lentisphaerae bacterium GWF2_44_16]HAU65890.1 hypothetical protein [Candidatus Uhrbacteria bacterium]